MPAFGIGHLRNVDFNNEIVDYIKRINGTLEPYGGASGSTEHRASRCSRVTGPAIWS